MLGKIISILLSIESKEGGPYYNEFPKKGSQNPKIGKKTNKIIDSFLSIYDIHLLPLKKYIGKENKNKKIAKNLEENVALGVKENIIKNEEKNIKNNITKNKTGDTINNALKKSNILDIHFDKKEEIIMRNIKDCLKNRLSSFSPEFKDLAQKAFEKTVAGNIDKQMSLISYYFLISLKKHEDIIKKELISKLGMINTFFWTAFIIYDDFWDKDEKAEPSLLPIANMFARDFTVFFSTYFDKNNSFKEYFNKIMDKLDTANTWEIKNCRAEVKNDIFYIPKKLPVYADYSKKYEPASGHILGPVLILHLIKETQHLKNLELFFKHLLITMQMNDDMHDIEEDIKRGHVSTAVCMILSSLPKNKETINLKSEMTEIRKIFWFKVLPILVKEISYHINESKKALNKIIILKNSEPLLNLVKIQKKINTKANIEYKNSVSFLKGYKNPTLFVG